MKKASSYSSLFPFPWISSSSLPPRSLSSSMTGHTRKLEKYGISGYAAVLYAGDVLYIPPFWMHHMTSLGADPYQVTEEDDCRSNVSISVSLWKESVELLYFKEAIRLPIPMRQSFSTAHKWVMTAVYLLLFLHECALDLEQIVSTHPDVRRIKELYYNNKRKNKEAITEDHSENGANDSAPSDHIFALFGVRGGVISQLLDTRYVRFHGEVSDEPKSTYSSRSSPKLDKNAASWNKVGKLACRDLQQGVIMDINEHLISNGLLIDAYQGGQDAGEGAQMPAAHRNLHSFARELYSTARSAADLFNRIKPPAPINISDITRDGLRFSEKYTTAAEMRGSTKKIYFSIHGIRYTLMQDYVEEFLKACVGTDNVYPFLVHFDRVLKSCRG
mmetsp:Transcript_13784/g.19104  ORF Transcript_13784/g.19104 Transcript_13784/m.19104 type:complete len:388 (+) Transcript_13784:214-1377(+)